MKRCALVISDDADFGRWVGAHISTCWPKMLVEHSKLAGAPMYLDRAPLERYRLLVVKLGFHTSAAVLTSLVLMRILDLDPHPDIVVIFEGADKLNAARTTGLGEAHCLLANQLTSANMQSLLMKLTHDDGRHGRDPNDGAPDIPGYTIQFPITATYAATLYRAYSQELRTDVALKICDVTSREHRTHHRLSLRQEYEILRELGGECIARAYDYGEVDNLNYMALEYFPRGTITRASGRSGQGMSRLHCMLEVARAIRSIHQAGILHLDIKPSNVLIRDDGSPALIDFGISQRTADTGPASQQGLSMGSPYFMSPEQARGEALDERSDIYSYGALWYRVFTGRSPFPGRTLEDVLAARHAQIPPTLGSALRHYQPVVDGTLATSPQDRFPDAQTLIDTIESLSASAIGLNGIGV